MTCLIIRYNLWYYNVLLVNFLSNIIIILYLKSFSGSLLAIEKVQTFTFSSRNFTWFFQSSISLLKFSTFLPTLTIFSSKLLNTAVLSSFLLIHTSRSCLCLLILTIFFLLIIDPILCFSIFLFLPDIAYKNKY